jgi:hypothetical protein
VRYNQGTHPFIPSGMAVRREIEAWLRELENASDEVC